MQNSHDSLRLENQLCFPIYLCAKEIVHKYALLLKKLDLTYTQYIVMMYFWEKRQSNVRNLSRVLLLDPSTLTPLLIKLENKGYITRTKSRVDGRNLKLIITAKGAKLEQKALSISKKMQNCVNLPENEAKILYELIYKVLNNIERNKNYED